MNRYIFDFDYTLFDTNAMRAAFQMALQEHCGTTVEEYQAAEKQITAEGKLYSLDAHLFALFPGSDEREQGRAVAESIVAKMADWLYPDVLPALKKLHTNQNQLTLLSFGNRKWQALKIAHVELTEFFDTVELVEGSKTEPVHLFEAETGGKIICINDRATEINELYGVFPHVDYVWMQRPDTPYNNTPPTAPHRAISDLSAIVKAS